MSLKLGVINRLYKQINMLNSLMTKLYKLVFREIRYELRFLSRKNSHTYLENSISLNHIVAVVDWRSWLILEVF